MKSLRKSSAFALPWQRIIISVSAGLLTACAVGPDFKQPPAPDATAYAPKPIGDSTVAAPGPGGDAQHFVMGRDIPFAWWTQFQSPQLNALVEKALKANPTITAEQIIQVLGQDKITAIAAKVGLSEPQVAEGISKILPVIVNHLTPNGTAPDPVAGELEGALGVLKSKLFSP